MFGQNKFGTGTGFGSSSTANTGLFGSTPASTGSTFGFGGGSKPGGLFGTQTSTSAGGFGSAASGGLFGNNNTTNTVFGAPTTTPQQASGGLFGSSQANNSFLKPATSNAFGASSGFGGSSGLFGSTATSSGGGGLFGSNQPSATGGGLFGSGGGAFGSTASAGTTSAKFSPVDGQDNMVKNGISTTVKTKHYCISGMKAYEGKSLEELRLEDYAAGVKGPKAAGATTGGLFGATQPAASTGFGAFGTPAASSSSGFGGFGTTTTQATTGFGLAKPTGGLFGSSTPATGGLFGQPAASTTGFGATSTTGQTGGLFGSTAAKPNPFGATPAFGQATTGFGQTSTASTGFGFGAKPTTGFGATTSASTGFGFGTQNTASTGFGFGAKPATGFGAQPAAGTTGGFGGFGTLGQTTGTSAFGLNKPATGFGGTTSAFGTGTTGFSSLGAATAQQQQQPVQLASNIDLQTQQAMVQQQIFNLANSPYGDSPLFRNIRKDSKNKTEVVPTDPATQKALLTSSGGQLKVNSRPAAKVKLTNISSVRAIGTASHNKGDLFEGLDDDSCYTPEKYGARRSVKKLVIRSPAVGGNSRSTAAGNHKSAFSSPSLYSGQNRSNAELAHSQAIAEETFDLSGVDKAQRRPINKLYPSLELDDTIGELQGGSAASNRPVKLSPRDRVPASNETYTANNGDSPAPTPAVVSKTNGVPQKLSVSKEEQIDISERDVETDQEKAADHPCGVICTRADYYTLPPLDELPDYMDSNGDCYIENLSIGREGYGSVFFPGDTNIAGLDIDKIVHFRRKEVTIYPDDDNKPAEGEGLNKRAEVTLDCVWPNDKSTRSPVKSPDKLRLMNFQEKIERASARIGAKFIDYRPDTGSWVFEVKHFSKYGLLDDDSDEENIERENNSVSDVKRLKALHLQNTSVQRQSIIQSGQKLASGDALTSNTVTGSPMTGPPISTNYLGLRNADEDEENHRPLDISNISVHHSTQLLQEEESKVAPNLVPVSHLLAAQCGVQSTSIQRMKASFLDADDDDLNISSTSIGHRRLTEGSPSFPLLKQHPASLSSYTPIPQSPLIKSKMADGSPSLQKLASSLYKTDANQEYLKREFDPDTKSIGSLLKPHRMSTEISVPEPDYTTLPSGMEKPLRPKSKIQGQRLQLSRAPFSKSLLRGREKCILDAACKEGHRSRSSWGSKMTLIHNGSSSVFARADQPDRLSTKFSILSPGRSRMTSAHQVSVESVTAGTQAHKTDSLVLETRIKALKVQLKHGQFSEEGGSPKFSPVPGIDALHEYGRESLNDLDAAVASESDSTIQSMFRHHILIWELAVALWGSLPEFEHIDDLDTDSYLYQNARSKAFSRWLSYAANFHVENETTKKVKQMKGVPAAIFSYLTARQIPEATQLAIHNKDLRLAMLISQAGTSQNVKTVVNKQLCDWNNTMADKYVSADRFKIYMLLAGSLVWENTTGLTNCCEDLDWKRALALHYWYGQAKMNISTAVAYYDVAWSENSECGGYAAPPVPMYMEESGEGASDCQDTCYHLLKLYSNSSYRLDKLLCSASSTPDPLDYHVSWHLMQVLQSLNYTHLDNHQTVTIHTRYACQLESCGLWEWAVLPLLNLECPHSRRKLIKDLLLRNVKLSVVNGDSGSDVDMMSLSEEMDGADNDYVNKEKFVVDQLRIPSSWLHEVKAIKARCEGLFEEEAWHLLLSHQLNPAHQIILRRIAPSLIISDDLDGLHHFLDILNKSCDSVSGWVVGGKIYLDYITIHDVIDELRQNPDNTNGYSLEKLKYEVQSLGRRLLSLSTPTPHHLLAQSTMALHTAHHLKFVMSLDADSRVGDDINSVSARHLAEPLSQLPLQSNDSVMFLKEAMSSFMLEY